MALVMASLIPDSVWTPDEVLLIVAAPQLLPSARTLDSKCDGGSATQRGISTIGFKSMGTLQQSVPSFGSGNDASSMIAYCPHVGYLACHNRVATMAEAWEQVAVELRNRRLQVRALLGVL
jgi:hypothetical protein